MSNNEDQKYLTLENILAGQATSYKGNQTMKNWEKFLVSIVTFIATMFCGLISTMILSVAVGGILNFPAGFVITFNILCPLILSIIVWNLASSEKFLNWWNN